MDEMAPRRPCPHPSPDDECRACRIERRARNNARDVVTARARRRVIMPAPSTGREADDA